jgi:hypothetical protein
MNILFVIARNEVTKQSRLRSLATGLPHKGTPIHYGLMPMWNRMLRLRLAMTGSAHD